MVQNIKNGHLTVFARHVEEAKVGGAKINKSSAKTLAEVRGTTRSKRALDQALDPRPEGAPLSRTHGRGPPLLSANAARSCAAKSSPRARETARQAWLESSPPTRGRECAG